MIENLSRFYYFIGIRICKIGQSRLVHRGRIKILIIIIIIIRDDCGILYNGTKHARHGRWAPSLPPHHLRHHIDCAHLYWCCYCFCCGAHASIAGVLVTSTPAEDARTRTTWINPTYVNTRVGASSVTLGLPFLTDRRSFSHRERMPPPLSFSEYNFPTSSFSKNNHRVDSTLVQGFRSKTPRAPNFGRLPNCNHVTFYHPLFE